jgi:hypothetical protein
MANDPEVLDEEEALPPETQQEASAFEQKLAFLQARCEADNIEYKKEIDEDGTPYAYLYFKAGRSKRRLAVISEDTADNLLSIDFARYSFMSGYEANIFVCRSLHRSWHQAYATEPNDGYEARSKS